MKAIEKTVLERKEDATNEFQPAKTREKQKQEKQPLQCFFLIPSTLPSPLPFTPQKPTIGYNTISRNDLRSNAHNFTHESEYGDLRLVLAGQMQL